MESILVIDDEEAIRYMIHSYLVEAGYEVKEAKNGEEGIDLIKNDDSFKMVITDIRMPKKDGNEVAKYIRSSYKLKKIPIVGITGYPDEVDNKLFNHIFVKPFKMEKLLEVINSFQ